jgi:mono/diheme cytochrome c family protein
MTKMKTLTGKTIAASLIALAALSFSISVPMMGTPVAHAEENGGRPTIVVPRIGGRDLFQKCVLCHKYDGRGGHSEGGAGADLRQTTLTRAQLIIIIKYGRQAKGMPPFQGIYDDEKIETLADFILEDLRLPELKGE